MNIAYGLTGQNPEFAGLSSEAVGQRLRQMGCDGVFLKVLTPDWVEGLQAAGLRVYASHGVFVDNADLWQRFPGSRPIQADGQPAPPEEWYRPLRPTDGRVWQLRLQQVEQLVAELQLDGVWLDFMRWPARWEKPEPRLYDSSFDPETLAQFQQETGIDLPTQEPAHAAAWILDAALDTWIDWRCRVIERFVAEAATRIRAQRPQATMGIFTLPWTGDPEVDRTQLAGVNRRIAGQDLARLGRHVDVISPMVYHRRCGRSPAWVGVVSRWAAKESSVEVWPVVEAIDPPEVYAASEFAEAVENAKEHGSGNIIVFKLEGLLADAAKQANLRQARDVQWATTLEPKPMQHSIPYGVADYFWHEAFQRQHFIGILLETFRRWGYGDVIPPSFEYAESLSMQASAGLQAEMYRFLDRDGSTLSLRPEFTTPVARLVATRLHDWPMPQRFCYAGTVFRYVEPQAGRQREFWQAGVELIGAPSPDADAEVVALTVAALRAADLQDFRVVLGQIRYFGGLLADLQLTPSQEMALQEAIDRKSEPALDDFLREVPLRTQQRRTIEELPLLNGDDLETVIAQADRHCLNYEMHAALENLRAICDVLRSYGVAESVDLDLTEIRNLGYYTGITFEVLTPGLGNAIGSGGRYDDLIGHFGRSQPAVGVALGLDRILLARQHQSGERPPTQPIAADCLVVAHGAQEALKQVHQWRQDGRRVQVEVSGRPTEEILSYARNVGIPQVLEWSGSGFDRLF